VNDKDVCQVNLSIQSLLKYFKVTNY